jgi:hypothetical protein
LPTHQGGKVILDKPQDGIGHRLQLTAQIVIVVDGGAAPLQRSGQALAAKG